MLEVKRSPALFKFYVKVLQAVKMADEEDTVIAEEEEVIVNL